MKKNINLNFENSSTAFIAFLIKKKKTSPLKYNWIILFSVLCIVFLLTRVSSLLLTYKQTAKECEKNVSIEL